MSGDNSAKNFISSSINSLASFKLALEAVFYGLGGMKYNLLVSDDAMI
jgi:hypothetical protein